MAGPSQGSEQADFRRVRGRLTPNRSILGRGTHLAVGRLCYVPYSKPQERTPMNKPTILLAVVVVTCLAMGLAASRFAGAESGDDKLPTRLAVVWTSGDADVAHRMVLMYVHASQKRSWFDENLVIVWGPSARLLAGDKDLQAKVKAMIHDGVKFQACIVCADMYGVSPVLRDLGIEVKPMGEPLTRLLQDDGWDVLTF